MMRTTRGKRFLYAAAVIAAALVVGAAAREAELPTYQAAYEVEYKSRTVGVADIAVSYDEASGVYRFESRTTATGLAKLLRPKPAVERSEFVLRDGTIRPMSFRFEDGSRKGEDNLDISFDWNAGVAAVTSEAGESTMPLQPGVLDRGTLQVVLMRDLARDQTPGPYVLADGDSLKEYDYSVDGEETVSTPSGTHEAVKLTQRRDGSSRETIVWAAPELSYLPVRIEQRREGETLTTLTLQSVEGL